MSPVVSNFFEVAQFFPFPPPLWRTFMIMFLLQAHQYFCLTLLTEKPKHCEALPQPAIPHWFLSCIPNVPVACLSAVSYGRQNNPLRGVPSRLAVSDRYCTQYFPKTLSTGQVELLCEAGFTKWSCSSHLFQRPLIFVILWNTAHSKLDSANLIKLFLIKYHYFISINVYGDSKGLLFCDLS